jgi:hypothetical protein
MGRCKRFEPAAEQAGGRRAWAALRAALLASLLGAARGSVWAQPIGPVGTPGSQAPLGPAGPSPAASGASAASGANANSSTTGAAIAAIAAISHPPTMVLWTANDCAFCRVWQRGERAQEFAALAERLGVKVGVMSKPSLRDPSNAYRWLSTGVPQPAELLAMAPSGLPTFEFFCNGRSQRRLAGLDNWDSFWRSEVRRLARECAVTPAAGAGP